MKKLLILLIPALLTTACAPGLYSMAAMSARSRHTSHLYNRPAEVSPVGRWDNVMMLEPGTPLKVLTMDGTVVTGNFVAATARTLRLGAGNLGPLAMTDVMRVDRVGTASASVAKQGARGAAIGIGAAGVFGLMLGIAPPPRVFAGAAVIGAYNGAADAAGAPRLGTIYVASSPATSGGGADLLAARTTTQRFNPRANTSMTPVITSHIPEAGAVGEGMVHAVSPYTTIATSHSRASR